MDCTCSALRMAARRLSQIYDAAVAPLGITMAQYSLLSHLDRWQGTPPTVSQLAGAMALDRTTLAHNLRPLERDGLVAILDDTQDRRARRVALTAAGRAKREEAQPLWRAAQARFDESFGIERSRALRRTLREIALGAPPSGGPDTQEDHHAG